MSVAQFNNHSLLRCVLVFLVLSIAILQIAPGYDSYGLTPPCDKGPSPPAASGKAKSSASVFDSFAFNYSKSGGFRSAHDKICYSSNDGIIIHMNNKSIIKKQLSNTEANDLKQKISNNVFDLNTYMPNLGSADYYNYNITVLLNGSKYRGSWTDASTGVPIGVLEIKNEIEKAFSSSNELNPPLKE